MNNNSNALGTTMEMKSNAVTDNFDQLMLEETKDGEAAVVELNYKKAKALVTSTTARFLKLKQAVPRDLY